MTFLNPILAMIGLGCVAVPIIIHILMRRRRRPVAWGAMRFLQEAYRRQRRRMNLEQLLLLASRCLLIALLALALGKPILGAAGMLTAGGPKTVYLLFDNSVASGLGADASGSGGAIEQHRRLALETIGTLDRTRGDRVGVLFLASPVEAAVLPPSAELAAVSEVIRQVKPADSRADLPSALSKLREELTRKENAESQAWVVVLSEFRAGSADTQTAIQSLGLPAGRITFAATEPAQEAPANVTIAAVEPSRGVLLAGGDGADAATSVAVSLTRGGLLDAATSTVTLRAALPESAPSAAAPPATEVKTTVQWSPGQASAQAFASVTPPKAARPGTPVVLGATIDRDPLNADNKFLRPVETRERLDIAIIAPGEVGARGEIAKYRAADWLALALSPAADLTLRRRQAGEIRVQAVDPEQGIAPGVASGTERATRGVGVLRGMDAILIPRPDLLDPAAWKAVREANLDGALVLVCPPNGTEAHAWTDAFAAALDVPWQIAREARTPAAPLEVSRERPVVSGSDLLGVIAAELPSLVKGVSVSRVLDVRGAAGSFEPILKLSDGSPLLVAAVQTSEKPGESPTTRGTLLYLAAAPDIAWTNLPATPLMVPLMQELVRQGVGRSLGSRATPAGIAPVLPRGAAELVRADGGDDHSSIAVSASGVPQSPIRTAGLWNVRGSGGATIGTVAFNADPAGCDLTPRSKEQIARWLAPAAPAIGWITPGGESGGGVSSGAGRDALGQELSRRQDTPPISVPLLIAAAIIAAVELILARIFSHATREEALGVSPASPAPKRMKEAA